MEEERVLDIPLAEAGVGVTIFKPLPVGFYQATIKDITVVASSYDKPGKVVGQFKFQMLLIDSEQEGHERYCWASRRMSKGRNKSKLYRWVSSVEGDLDEDYIFKPDKWIGRQIQVVVEHIEKDDGSIYDKIANWLPPSKEQMELHEQRRRLGLA